MPLVEQELLTLQEHPSSPLISRGVRGARSLFFVCSVLYIMVFTFVFLAIVLSVLWSTATDYLLGIFWPLYCLSFDLQLLITSLVSFGHCIVCPLIYSYWLPLYLLAIVLSVLWSTATDYLFGIFWALYCLSFDLQLLITSLVSFGHCIVCPSIYSYWLPLWYLLAIVLSVLWSTATDYLFGIFWPLHCLSFDLQLLITSLVFVGHCIVCPSIYSYWLPLWYFLAIVLSVLRSTATDYLLGIFWTLYCMSFDLQLLITSLVSFGHCIVYPLIYSYWLLLWYLLAIVLYVLWSTATDYLFGIFWTLYCLSFDLQLLITSLVSFGHCIVCPLIYSYWLPLWYLLDIVLSVLWSTATDYLIGIFWPLYCLSFDLQLLITSLVSFGHCIVCPLIYSYWLPLWYLLDIVLSVLWSTDTDYLFGIFWTLYCLSFDLQLLITSLVSFGHCIVCPLIYSYWLPLWYLLATLYCLSFDLQLLITSLVSFGHYSYCLSFDLQLLITSLLSFGHCIVCPLIYSYWLPLWYLLDIVLSVLWSTATDYFGISLVSFGFWTLYCLSFDLQLLITSLVSFGHCIVCPLIYSYWLPLCYLLDIVLSVLWSTATDYLFGIFWTLYCLSFDLQLLITSLVSFGHCIVCPLIYSYWLPLIFLYKTEDIGH